MRQKRRRQRKRKPQQPPKLAFEPGKVFDAKPAHDLDELDLETRRALRAFRASKGQGGDRSL